MLVNYVRSNFTCMMACTILQVIHGWRLHTTLWSWAVNWRDNFFRLFFFLVFALLHSADPRPMCLPAGGCVSVESQFMVTQGSLLLNRYLVHGDEACVHNWGAKFCAPFWWVQSMQCSCERDSFDKLNRQRFEVRWWLNSLRHHNSDSQKFQQASLGSKHHLSLACQSKMCVSL